MRRLACLGVALAAILVVSASVSGDPQEMSSSEKSKVRAALEPYFKEADWQRRDAALLRSVERVLSDLDSKRARGKKGSCLADVAGLREAIFGSQSYDSKRRKGLRRITWNESPFPVDPPVFYVSVPKRYRPATPTPLIIALHPLGMDAEGYANQALLKFKEIQGEFFLVAPQWPDRTKATWGTENDEGAGRALIGMNFALQKFFIDPDRIYVVGEAEGGTAALDLAMALGDRFAGVFAIGGGKDRKLEDNLKGVPVHRIAGGAARPHLPAYDEVTKTILAEDGLRRQPFPKKIEWRFETLGQQMAWWIFVRQERAREDESEPGHINAEIKEGNVIEVTAEGVDAFDLFLNDQLVNLDEEVQVIINGVQQAPWQPERRLADAIEWMMDIGDLGRIFVARKEFVVPVENGDK